jgi:hypothetical protein
MKQQQQKKKKKQKQQSRTVNETGNSKSVWNLQEFVREMLFLTC